MNNNQVSNWLSRFFILHFIIDLTLALPLFFWSEPFLKFIGWLILIIFVAFNILWIYWRVKLN